MKLPGVISFRKLRPICAMPKGSFRRIAWSTFSKLTNMPWAVSGRRYVTAASSSTGPRKVFSIMLNCRGSVSVPFPHTGQRVRCAPQCLQASPAGISNLLSFFAGQKWSHGCVSMWSARNRRLHSRQSTIGSVNRSRWPLASHTRGCISTAASSPSTSRRRWTVSRHQRFRTLRLSSTPSGP